jgi:hypothetical protein
MLVPDDSSLHVRLDLHSDLLRELHANFAEASLQIGLHLHDDLLQELSGLASISAAAASLQIGLHLHVISFKS